jgi:hypothetical protein
MEPIDNNLNQPNQFNQYQEVPAVPNSTAILVLGIISIVGAICYGIPGLICGIIALVLAGKSRRMYNENPGRYSLASYNNMNAGRVCAIIGTILSALAIIGLVFYFIWIFSFMEDMGAFPNRY